MKAQILKIAGVKSEKEFYKKYPSEEAFMKKHGKEFKKAQVGAMIGGDTSRLLNNKMLKLKDFNDQADLDVTGMTDDMRQKQAEDEAKAAAATKADGSSASGAGIDSLLKMLDTGASSEGGSKGGMNSIMSMFGGSEVGTGAAAAGGARYGKQIPMAQAGAELLASYYNNLQNTPNISNVIQSQTQSPGVNASMYKSNGPGPVNNSAVSNYGTFAPGNYNSWDIDNNGVPDTVQQSEGNPLNKEYTGYQGVAGQQPKQSGIENVLGGLAKNAGPIGDLYDGYKQLRAERRARKEAEQQKVVSDITLKASETRPEEIKRKYVRPEDIENTGEEFFPIYGVGTNVLARNGARLQYGGMIEGNPTEVQNTYGNGNSIYDDLGYVPLINENQQKSFRQGGYIHQAQNGFSNWQNSMNGGGSAWSGAGESGGTPYGAIGHFATGLGQTAMGGQNGGGKIGGTIGKSVGSIFGPAGGAIGEFVGGMAGNVLDTNAKQMKRYQNQTKRNVTKMGLNSGFQSVQAGNASYVRDGGDIPNYEDGGYMNPEYNPQVITMFGDVNDQDFADFAHKDEFRAGGHLKSYTPPSARAMQTYEDGGDVRSYGLGGELETHWGGGAETMSYNPYLPGTGETVMFRGKSHEEYSPNGETGIGVTYGGNPVEVERGEPMVELADGGTIDPMTGEPQKSGVVFGNLQIPNQYIDLLGDKNAKGKKFKNYVADLSKTEEKQNKMIAKSTEELNALDINSSFDRLKLSSLQANIEGGNLKLKELADKKIKAADLQNAINDTAEEYGLIADDLARGKVKKDKEAMKEYAKFGGKFTKAQNGKKAKFNSEKEALEAGYVKGADGTFYRIIPPEKSEPIETKIGEADTDVPLQHIDELGLYGGVTGEKLAQAQRNNSWFKWEGFNPGNKADVLRFQKEFNQKAKAIGSNARVEEDGKFGKQTASAVIDEKRKVQPSVGTREEAEIVDPGTQPISYKRSPWIDFGNQVLDYIRPTDQEAFDNAQIYPEMYAMSSNQLEPVPTQSFQPELGVPYDISLQDQLNANQADYRAAQRIAGYNPAAQANLNAQKYQANQEILGTQFRANQAMKDKVYGENRNILNQAKLTNLGIYDKQYERQAEALSNTKATTQAALNSIADKYAKNKLENRTLGIYENLYKYRYDKSGRAINMNGLFQANIPTVGSVTGTQRQVPVYEADGKTIKYYQLQEMTPEEMATEEENNSGAIPSLATLPINGNAKTKTKTKKESRNGSIVKAIKKL